MRASSKNVVGDSETEARILDAAHRVFLRRGTAGARTQEIADEAGVNKALIHYYFRSKDRLAEVVFLRAARMLFPRILETMAADIPIREKLNRVVQIELDVLEENPYIPGYVISEFRYRPDRLHTLLSEAVDIQAMRTAVLTKLQSQLDAEADAGTLRPSRADDLLVTVMSQLVFPFAAAPMLQAVLGLDDEARRGMIARRRADLAASIARSLEP